MGCSTPAQPAAADAGCAQQTCCHTTQHTCMCQADPPPTAAAAAAACRCVAVEPICAFVCLYVCLCVSLPPHLHIPAPHTHSPAAGLPGPAAHHQQPPLRLRPAQGGGAASKQQTGEEQTAWQVFAIVVCAHFCCTLGVQPGTSGGKYKSECVAVAAAAAVTAGVGGGHGPAVAWCAQLHPPPHGHRRGTAGTLQQRQPGGAAARAAGGCCWLVGWVSLLPGVSAGWLCSCLRHTVWLREGGLSVKLHFGSPGVLHEGAGVGWGVLFGRFHEGVGWGWGLFGRLH